MAMVYFLCALALAAPALAFYVPGAYPQEFREGDPIQGIENARMHRSLHGAWSDLNATPCDPPPLAQSMSIR
jgi:hypothetical protein